MSGGLDTVVFEAEKTLLGAVLLENSLWHECAHLTPSHFGMPSHGAIYSAMTDMVPTGGFDLQTLSERLHLTGQMDRVGGPGALAGLIASLPVLNTAKHYVEIVERAHFRRRLVKACMDTIKEVQESADPTEVLARAEARLSAVGGSVTTGWYDGPTLAAMEGDDYNIRSKREAGRFVTGLRDLDSIVDFSEGSVWVLGARTSIGKSAFLGNVVKNNVREGNKILWVVLEMGARRNFWRVLAASSGIPLNAIRSAKLGLLDKEQYGRRVGEYFDRPNLRLADHPGMSAGALAGYIRRAKQEMGGLDGVCLDYFQLITSPRQRKDDREEFNGTIKSLVETAARERVPLLVGAQLNRNAETDSKDDRPSKSELKGTGNLEEAASGIILLHRWGRQSHEESNKGAEIIIAKQQDGPTGILAADFDEKTQNWWVR